MIKATNVNGKRDLCLLQFKIIFFAGLSQNFVVYVCAAKGGINYGYT